MRVDTAGFGLVAHLVRDEGVAGSNPATPTTKQPTKSKAYPFGGFSQKPALGQIWDRYVWLLRHDGGRTTARRCLTGSTIAAFVGSRCAIGGRRLARPNRPIPAAAQGALITPLARHFLASRGTCSLRLIASCTPRARSAARPRLPTPSRHAANTGVGRPVRVTAAGYLTAADLSRATAARPFHCLDPENANATRRRRRYGRLDRIAPGPEA
jgi:hypothetical protein